ncbi:protein kinase domain-containing protein [Nocardia sp. NPDC004722]
MSVGRKFVSVLTQQAARDLGLQRYWPAGILLLVMLQTCHRDARTFPAAVGLDGDRLSDELGELRELVRRAGIDLDRAVEASARKWRAERSAPWNEDEPRLRPHTQVSLIYAATQDLARADPRAVTADGEVEPRVAHLFLAVLDHPDGTVHELIRALGTEVGIAREAAAVPGDEWVRGEVVADRYEVTDVITAGGMGVVYRVFHRDWGIDLAVKAPRASSFTDPEIIASFEAEARAWLELGEHPNVVACTYVSRYRGLPRVFAEWMPGGSLTDAIENRDLYADGHRIALERVLDIAIQSARGLAHVHACGLVHQDVKPGNILLATESGGTTAAKVTDIGLARAWTVGPARVVEHWREAIDLAGTVAAGYAGMTPAYCSPEQYEWSTGAGQLLDRATDIWSWAATVVAMFTGLRPTELGTRTPAVLARLVNGDYVPGAQPGPDVPPLPHEIAEVLAECLQPHAHRPRDIAAVADRLAAAQQRIFGRGYRRPVPKPAPRSPENAINEALSWVELGELDAARRILTIVLDQDPSHPYAVFHLNRLAWKSGLLSDLHMRDSVLALQRASPLDPVHELLLAAVDLERCDGDRAREALALLPYRMPHDPMAERLRTLSLDRQVLGTPSTTHLGGPISELVVAEHEWIAAVVGRSVHLYGPMLRSGPVITPPGEAPVVMALNPADHTVTIGCDGTAYVHDIESGTLTNEYRSATTDPSSTRANGVSRDGSLAVAGTADGAVLLTETATGRILRTFDATGEPVTHAYLADRTVVVARADGSITKYPISRPADATLILPQPGWRQRRTAIDAAVHHTRQLLRDGDLAGARASLRRTQRLPAADRDLDMVALRRTVFGPHRGAFRALWPRLLGVGLCAEARLDPDGSRVAIRPLHGTDSDCLWVDTITGHRTPAPGMPPRAATSPRTRPPRGDIAVEAVRTSRDGRVALLTGVDGSHTVWYPEQARAGAALGPGPVSAAALSADGTFAIVYRSGLRLLDIETGELFGTADDRITDLTDIQLSDDGRVAITMEGRKITLWELVWD